jgi:hypothetical protein
MAKVRKPIPAPSVPLTDIGLERWQYDLWYQILSAALLDHPDTPNADYNPALNKPAISRYGATTPALLRWFETHNRSRRYVDQVRPFGFLAALQGKRLPSALMNGEPQLGDAPQKKRRIRPIAPYHQDPAAAAIAAFDRKTGEPVPAGHLASYAEALAQYHLHPEAKFLNGDYRHRGVTRRRHIQVAGIRYIGKEANRWEEQFFLGPDPEADIEYRSAPDARAEAEERVRDGIRQLGHRAVARAARMSLRDVGRAAREPAKLSAIHLRRLDRALAQLAAKVKPAP